jgi:hypothetical protein
VTGHGARVLGAASGIQNDVASLLIFYVKEKDWEKRVGETKASGRNIFHRSFRYLEISK